MTKLTAIRTAFAALVVTGFAAPMARADDAALIERGAYVAKLGDCVACHTAKGGAEFAGGLPMATPIGKIYSTNITPDVATGIGSWSYDDFARLMRTGVRKDGTTVYPAMPYPSYERVSDGDMHALYAFMTQGVHAVSRQNRASDIPWPLSMRWPLAIWRHAFAPAPSPAADMSDASEPSIARGAYLVEGLGHCGSCHTPRSLTMQEKALRPEDGSAYLAGGGPIDGWPAPSLRNEGADSLGGWSVDDIVLFLKTGRNQHGATFGAMNDVIVHSMQHTSDRDLRSIAMFLKSLTPASGAAPVAYHYDPAAATELQKADVSRTGAQIYVDRCAACHRTDGKGYPGVFPPLAGNPVLQTASPKAALHIVLAGGQLPGLKTAPSRLVMGGYADILSDQEVADVVTFIQTSWGNAGGKATESDARDMRKATAPLEDSAAFTPKSQDK